jgi:soluble lytic murein transglycosylase
MTLHKALKPLVVLILFAVMLCFTLARDRHGHLTQPPRSAHSQHVVSKITEYVLTENENLSSAEALSISEAVLEESGRHDLDYRFVLAVMKVESNFRYRAVSPQGARGLLQVKPSLAKHIAEDAGVQWHGAKTLDEPEKNIRIGVYFLSDLIDTFETTVAALHAYNIGPTRLRESAGAKNRTPRGFSKSVLQEYDRNTEALPDP